jgi:hypothetical protein
VNRNVNLLKEAYKRQWSSQKINTSHSQIQALFYTNFLPKYGLGIKNLKFEILNTAKKRSPATIADGHIRWPLADGADGRVGSWGAGQSDRRPGRRLFTTKDNFTKLDVWSTLRCQITILVATLELHHIEPLGKNKGKKEVKILYSLDDIPLGLTIFLDIGVFQCFTFVLDNFYY